MNTTEKIYAICNDILDNFSRLEDTYGKEYFKCIFCDEKSVDSGYNIIHKVDCVTNYAKEILASLEVKRIPITFEELDKYRSVYEFDVLFKVFGDSGSYRKGRAETYSVLKQDEPYNVICQTIGEKEIRFEADVIEEMFLIEEPQVTISAKSISSL